MEAVRIVAADCEHADPVDRHEHGRTHFHGLVAEQRVEFFRLQPAGAQAMPAFAEFMQRNEPLCGRLQPDKLDALFGARAADVRSAVLVPIDGLGMLAIGSHDANRFHPGMGTVFLKLIAEAAAAAIVRFPATD